MPPRSGPEARASEGNGGRARRARARRRARPSRPLRESVATSTTSRKPISQHQPLAHTVAGLEPQVERRQDEQRDDQHDPEVVRIARERVRPVDVRAVDRAVDVDLARAAGERREDDRVEVRPSPRIEQLQDAVERVHDDPARRTRRASARSTHVPAATSRRRRPRGTRSGSPTSSSPSPTARARPNRQIEEAGEVHDQEERRRSRAAPPSSAARRGRFVVTSSETMKRMASTSESRRCPRCSSAPSRTCNEERREEQEARQSPHASRSSELRELLHARPARHPPAPLLRERRAVERALPPARVQIDERSLDPLDVVGRDDDPGRSLADQLSRGAVGRHERQDRPLGGEVLEHLPGEDALAAPAGLGDQEQQRLGVALELERPPARRVRDQLQPVAEPQLLGPLAVGRAEVADEARVDVEARSCSAVRNGRGSRLPKNDPAWVIRNRSARCTRARRSRRSRSRSRSSPPRPAGSRSRISPRSRRRRTTIASAERATSDATACSPCSFSAHEHPLGVRGAGGRRPSRAGRRPSGIAGRPLDGGADEVDRGRRRRGHDDVDPLASARCGSPPGSR